MGRTIVAEESVQEQINLFYGKEEWFIGFIIGQLTKQKDYVAHLARVIQEDADKADSEDEDASAKTKAQKMSTLETVDEQWVASNAKQVLRMLPGGLDVVGVFALAPPAMMQAAQNKLRQVLFAVQKVINKTEILPQDDDITDRVLLQICSTTRKLTCRTFDVADHKSSAKPADWKFQSFADQWLQVNATVSFDIVIPVPTSQLSQQLHKQIQSGLLPHCEAVNQSIVTLNNQMLPPGEPLVTSQHSKKKKQKGESSSTTAPVCYTAQFFSHTPLGSRRATFSITDCTAKLLFRGTLYARAHLHPKATAGEATKGIKRDVLRTLVSRCDLLCEDLLQTEEEQDPKVLYETPVRIFARLGATPLTVCDYMFQDEQASDSAERFLELLDLTVDQDSMELELEHVPGDDEIMKPMRSPKHSSIEDEVMQRVERKKQFTSIAGLALSGTVALIAACISYMYLGPD